MPPGHGKPRGPPAGADHGEVIHLHTRLGLDAVRRGRAHRSWDYARRFRRGGLRRAATGHRSSARATSRAPVSDSTAWNSNGTLLRVRCRGVRGCAAPTARRRCDRRRGEGGSPGSTWSAPLGPSGTATPRGDLALGMEEVEASKCHRPLQGGELRTRSWCGTRPSPAAGWGVLRTRSWLVLVHRHEQGGSSLDGRYARSKSSTASMSFKWSSTPWSRTGTRSRSNESGQDSRGGPRPAAGLLETSKIGRLPSSSRRRASDRHRPGCARDLV